jgi:hypothetical protein
LLSEKRNTEKIPSFNFKITCEIQKTHTCIPSRNNYVNLEARLEIRDLAVHVRHANAVAIGSMSVRITVKTASERQ